MARLGSLVLLVPRNPEVMPQAGLVDGQIHPSPSDQLSLEANYLVVVLEEYHNRVVGTSSRSDPMPNAFVLSEK